MREHMYLMKVLLVFLNKQVILGTLYYLFIFALLLKYMDYRSVVCYLLSV